MSQWPGQRVTPQAGPAWPGQLASQIDSASAATFDAPLPVDRPSEASMLGRDIAGATGAGLVRGAAGVVGMPEDLRQLASQGAGWLLDQSLGRAVNRITQGTWDAPNQARQGLAPVGPTSADVTRAIEQNVTGPLYQAQTMPGQYAETISRNAAMAAATPGSALQRAAMAFFPGVAEETAGQVTKGSAMEPYARAGAGLAAGIGTAVAMRPSYAERAFGREVQALTDPQAAQAQRLMAEARAQGVPLTNAEAIQRATNGATGLPTVQMRMEQSAGGQEVLRPFMAQRGEQVRTAVGGALDEIAPQVVMPTATTGQARAAAETVLNRTRDAINQRTDPLYQAAAQARVSSADMAALMAHPSYSQAMQAVRANPELRQFVGNLPDDSVAVVDKVKQLLAAEASRTGGPFNQQPFGNAIASVKGDAADMARRAGTSVSPEYAQALAEQARLRQGILDPLTQGPVGQVAQATDPRGVIRSLVPAQPLPNQSGEVGQAARLMTAADPAATRGVVRMALEDQWNAAQRGGPRVASQAEQFAGAQLAKALRGEAGAVQDAAIRNSAGPAAADRTQQLLRVLEATGERLPQGSATEFNRQFREASERGGLSGLLTQAGRPIAAARDAVAQARSERNSDRIARLLIDQSPEAIASIRDIGKRVNSAERDMLFRLLMSFGSAAQPAQAVQ